MDTGYITIDVDCMKVRFFDDFICLFERDASAGVVYEAVKEAAAFYRKCLEMAEGD